MSTLCRNGVVTIRLPGDEASDVLNFVLKDDATNTWYDNNNKNFAVSLRAPKAAVPGVTKAIEVPDQLPRALCDTWAWIKWDHAGTGGSTGRAGSLKGGSEGTGAIRKHVAEPQALPDKVVAWLFGAQICLHAHLV